MSTPAPKDDKAAEAPKDGEKKPDVPADGATAELDKQLDPIASARIKKAERRDSIRISKLIQCEAQTGQKTLGTAMNELAGLHKTIKAAAAEEAKAINRKTLAANFLHKMQMQLLQAKEMVAQSEADVKAKEEEVEACKKHIVKLNEDVKVKNKEIEDLRKTKAVADREREVKLKQLMTA